MLIAPGDRRKGFRPLGHGHRGAAVGIDVALSRGTHLAQSVESVIDRGVTAQAQSGRRSVREKIGLGQSRSHLSDPVGVDPGEIHRQRSRHQSGDKRLIIGVEAEEIAHRAQKPRITCSLGHQILHTSYLTLL